MWQRVRVLIHLSIHNSYNLATDRVGCSPIQVRRWEQIIRSYRMSGGHLKLNLTGEDQLFFSIYLYIYPNASSDELCISIIVNGGGVYSGQIISCQYSELRLSRKRRLRENYEAFSQLSLRKATWLRADFPPISIYNMECYKLIDYTETQFYLKSIASTYGRNHPTCQVRHLDHYTRSEQS